MRLLSLGASLILLASLAIGLNTASAEAAAVLGLEMRLSGDGGVRWDQGSSWTMTATAPPVTMVAPGTQTATYNVTATRVVISDVWKVYGRVCVKASTGSGSFNDLVIVAKVVEPGPNTILLDTTLDTSSFIVAAGALRCTSFLQSLTVAPSAGAPTLRLDLTATTSKYRNFFGTPHTVAYSRLLPTPVAPNTPNLPIDVIAKMGGTGKIWTTTATNTYAFTRIVACPTDAGTKRGEFTIAQTRLKATADLVVTCP